MLLVTSFSVGTTNVFWDKIGKSRKDSIISNILSSEKQLESHSKVNAPNESRTLDPMRSSGMVYNTAPLPQMRKER